MKQILDAFVNDIRAWGRGWYIYIEKKLARFGFKFENSKGYLVDILMARRGSYQRPFLHFSLGVLFVAGVVSAPILASEQDADISQLSSPSAALAPLDLSEYGIQTQISQKPRDQVIIYKVKDGDTLSNISEKFGVSIDTIKWANDIKRETLSINQELKIPPVTGVVHRVREGENVYTIARKYSTDAQKIVNFPFNDFADLDTFALKVGQTLVVPDGVIAKEPIRRVEIAPVVAGGTGQYHWPTNGAITQYPVWYHMALDIASPSAPSILASDGGTVVLVSRQKFGYGYHVILNHGDGMTTLYGHMSEIYVDAGQTVTRGQVLGKMGSTGRSTGTHLHFEIRKNNVTLNPLPYLK